MADTIQWRPTVKITTRQYSVTALLVLFPLAALTRPALGQRAEDCAVLMKSGIYDKFKSLTTESQYRLIKEFFKNNQFSSRQQAQSAAGTLGIDIEGVLGLSFDGKSSSSSFEQWQ